MKLNINQRLELMIPVCQAIQHAHQKGIIHRDIKPSNVLVAQYDGRPVPKVIDFGVAKAVSQLCTEKTLFTEFGQIVGTLEYMSPEQAELNHLDVDTRSDVYSLGVLLYELLTGYTPIDGKKLRSVAFGEMLRMIREEDPPTPSNRLSTIDTLASVAANRQIEPKKISGIIRGELDWLVMMALDKDRNRRYETANAMAMDIQRYLLDERVLACPPTTRYRLRKFARRNKALLITGATIITSIVAGLIGTSWQAYRATKAENAAIRERDQKDLALKAAFASAELERRAKEAEAIARESESKQRQKAESAEAEARDREREAKRQLEQSRAVTDFLQNDLLRQAGSYSQSDTKFKPDPSLTVLQALDRASAVVGDRFKDRPELEASIRFAIGCSYWEIGKFDEAVDHLQKSVELRQAILGTSHLDTLESQFYLAKAQVSAGNADKAIQLLEKLRDDQLRIQGPDHPNTLATISGLAVAYQESGRVAEAIRLLESVHDTESKIFGPEDSATIATLQCLAVAYNADRRSSKAISMLEKVRDVRLQRLGPDHLDTLGTLANLAALYIDAGQHSKAVTLLKEVHEKKTILLGPEHPDTLSTLANLAFAYEHFGERTEAIALLEKVRDAEQRVLGPEHPDVLETVTNLAELYQEAGRNVEAIKMLEQVRDIVIRLRGMEHPATIDKLNNLAVAYARHGQASEAIQLMEKILEVDKRNHDAEHLQTIDLLANLAAMYDSSGRVSEAIAIYESIQKVQTRELGADHQDTVRTLSNLAAAYWRSKQLHLSIPLFEDVLKRREAELGRSHPKTLLTVANLGVNYRDAGRLDEAIPLLEEACRAIRRVPSLKVVVSDLLEAYTRAGKKTEALELVNQSLKDARRNLPPESPELAAELAQLGTHLVKFHSWQDAEAILRECLAIREALLPEDWRTFNTRSLLGGCLLGEEKFSEAEPLLLAGYQGMKLRESDIPAQGMNRITESLERLVALYTTWQKPEQAEEWQKALEEWSKQLESGSINSTVPKK